MRRALSIVPVQDGGQWLAEFREFGQPDPAAYTEWTPSAAAMQARLLAMAKVLATRFSRDEEFLGHLKTTLVEGIADVVREAAEVKVNAPPPPRELPPAPVRIAGAMEAEGAERIAESEEQRAEGEGQESGVDQEADTVEVGP